ncbi:MAG: AMP-binding protein, partial [Ignavibacteria bacterium]|nr:AMP-binding protein [Ignavibacteria bacterium]
MPIYKDFKTIPQLFQIITQDFGKGKERPVLKYYSGNTWQGIKYDELYEATKNFAQGLAALGVKRGDKVSIIAENRPEWVYSDMAVLGLGGIDVPLYPISTSETIEFCVNNSESVGIIVS